jgi:hypothetical protein
MTRQYVVGELSLILGELQAATTDETAVQDVACLRQEVETTPPAALAPIAARAMELTDGVCWSSLARGETAAFVREAAICAELWEFGVCAGLLGEDEASD